MKLETSSRTSEKAAARKAKARPGTLPPSQALAPTPTSILLFHGLLQRISLSSIPRLFSEDFLLLADMLDAWVGFLVCLFVWLLVF